MALPVGRPPKYETPEEMQKIIDMYFLGCRFNSNPDFAASKIDELTEEELQFINWLDDLIPTVSGLAYCLDLSRQGLLEYSNKDEFSDTIKRAKLRIEKSLEQRLATGQAAGTIFNLKNNFGWKDKTEQELTGADGGPIKTDTTFKVEFVEKADE